MDSDEVLVVEDLTVEFATDGEWVRVVDGVCFALPRGTTLGIVGESGCGKSVTALAVMGLLDRHRSRVTGSVRLGGRELIGLPERDLLEIRGRDMGMIFQEPRRSLDPSFSVGDQIAEVLVRHKGMRRRDAFARAAALLDRVGIVDPKRRIRDYPHQFSGGMCQRVMLAIAVACGPQVIIVDEPTTALDVTIQRQVLALMNDLQDELGVSIVLITHDLGVVGQMCDEVSVMYAGQVVESAGLYEVFHQPRHPYTQGLLAAIPDPAAGYARLVSIQGTVPAPSEWPASCRFFQRCAYAQRGRCDSGPIALTFTGSGHQVRCVREAEIEMPELVG